MNHGQVVGGKCKRNRFLLRGIKGGSEFDFGRLFCVGKFRRPITHHRISQLAQTPARIHHGVDGGHHALSRDLVSSQIHAKVLPIGPVVQGDLNRVRTPSTDDTRQ